MNKNFSLSSIIDDLYVVGFEVLVFFGLVYYYQLFSQNVLLAVIPFSLMWCLQSLFTIPASKIVGTIGTQKAFAIGVGFFILSTIPLYHFSQTENVLFLGLWILCFAGGKAFYHPSQMMTQGTYSTQKGRGHEYAFRFMLFSATSIVTPLLAGFVTQQYGVAGLAITACIVYLVALIPISKIESVYFTVDMPKITAALSSSQTKHLLRLAIFSTPQSVFRLFWPVYIFVILKESYSMIGIFLACITLVAIVLLYIFGKLLDRFNRETIFKEIMATSGFAWILKALSINPLYLAIVGIFHNVVQKIYEEVFSVVAVDLLTNHVQKDKRDETLMTYEVLTNAIAGISLIIGAIIATFFGFRMLFIFTGLSTILCSIFLRQFQYSKKS